MRNAIVLALVGLALMSAPLAAAPGSPAKPAPTTPMTPCGIKVDKQVIRPGQGLPIVFGVIGPPDSVRAMRSKKEADDYVLFAYFSQGFSVDIVWDTKLQSNVVKGVLVESRDVAFDGIPFKVGDTKAAVLKAWGEPDRTASNTLSYWRRGVYVGHDEAGNVVNIYLAPPGKVDEPSGPSGTGPG